VKTYGTVKYKSDPGARLGYFHIVCEPHVAMVLRRIFDGSKRGRDNAVVVSGTDANCHTLEWALIKYPMEVDTPVLKRGADRQRQRMAMVEEARSPDYVPPVFDLAIPLRDYQRVAADLAIRSRGLLLGDDVGLGKAQPIDALVLTPTGWRAIGDLRVGDRVVDPDGGEAAVTGVFPQGERQVYRVTIKDGTSAESCEAHLWGVYTANDRTRGGSMRVLELKQIMGDLRGKEWKGWASSKWFLPLPEPIVFDAAGERPVDPYLLGVLIGDGGLSGGAVNLMSPDVEIVSRVRATIPAGTTLIACDGREGHYRVSRGKPGGENPLMNALRDLDLMGKLSVEKRIPVAYLRAPVAERLELLRGLMDTDGDCTKLGACMFNTSSPGLRDDVVDLVRGLGGIASIYDRPEPKFTHKGETRIGQPAYRVNVRLAVNPFHLIKKAERWHRPNMARAIHSVEPTRRVETVCIRVASKRHLYITDGHIVTHNTAECIATFVVPDTLPAIVVTLTHLTGQWQREVNRFAPALRVHVIQRVQAYPLVDNYGWEVHKGKRRYVRSGIAKMPDVIILSYSKLVGWADMLISINPGMLVFDECQELRTGATDGGSTHGSKKNDAAKAIAFRSRYRVGASVGPDSIIELRGSLFGAGWVGRMEDAVTMVASVVGAQRLAESDFRDVAILGIESRGWTGNGFGWKRVRKFIVHECNEPVRTLRIAGDGLLLTDDHDVFVARRQGRRDYHPEVITPIAQVPAKSINKGDIVPVDDGAAWGGNTERLIDTASILTHLGWAQVPVYLGGLDRHILGVKQYEWANYRKQGTFGHYLPVRLYLQHRHRLPVPPFIYLSKCKRITKIAMTIRLSDWAYVLGFFLGDGWLDKDTTRVSFAVELSRKDDFIARLRLLPGIDLDPKVRVMPGKSVEIRVSNVLFASVLRHAMGKHLCHEKTIPGEWIVSWPESARRELLRGMLESDGHVSARANRRWYATSSQKMARAMLSLLRSLGIIGGIGTRKPAAGGVIRGRQIVGKRTGYMVHWSAFAEAGDNTGYRGARRALPGTEGRFNEGVVRGVESAPVPALVYDLEMDGHPSFVANGALVHNSATPIFNLGGEVWNVMDVLSPGLLGDKQEFYTEWCTPQGNGKYLVNDINALRVYLTGEGAMLRRRRKDVGRELPPMMRNWQTVELNRKGLDSISSHVAELARAVLRDDIAPFAKMQAAGELDRQLRQATGVAKIPSVLAFVEMLIHGADEPEFESVVVFAHHHLVFDALLEGLTKAGIKAAKFTGKQSKKEKDEALDRFTNGDLQVLLLANRAGVGIDGLQAVCSVGVVAELDWSPGVHLQNEGRLNRDGQEENVVFYYLVSDEGSDPVVRDVLGIKESQRHGLVDGDLGDTSDEPPVDLNRMRKMAQAYLDKHKVK
jgi:hypothetical protein